MYVSGSESSPLFFPNLKLTFRFLFLNMHVHWQKLSQAVRTSAWIRASGEQSVWLPEMVALYVYPSPYCMHVYLFQEIVLFIGNHIFLVKILPKHTLFMEGCGI